MSKLNPKELAKCETSRDIGAEIRRGLKQVHGGRAARERRIEVPKALEARMHSGLSQQRFADVLGVSRRTLEAWEQGRRKPTGAALSLLMIATKRPEVLREVLSG